MRTLGPNPSKPNPAARIGLTFEQLLRRLSPIFVDSVCARLNVNRHKLVDLRVHLDVRPDVLVKEGIPPLEKLLVAELLYAHGSSHFV
jgi:hypothetical protein